MIRLILNSTLNKIAQNNLNSLQKQQKFNHLQTINKPRITPRNPQHNKNSNKNLKDQKTLKIIIQQTPSWKSKNPNPNKKVSDTNTKPIPSNLQLFLINLLHSYFKLLALLNLHYISQLGRVWDLG